MCGYLKTAVICRHLEIPDQGGEHFNIEFFSMGVTKAEIGDQQLFLAFDYLDRESPRLQSGKTTKSQSDPLPRRMVYLLP